MAAVPLLPMMAAVPLLPCVHLVSCVLFCNDRVHYVCSKFWSALNCRHYLTELWGDQVEASTTIIIIVVVVVVVVVVVGESILCCPLIVC